MLAVVRCNSERVLGILDLLLITSVVNLVFRVVWVSLRESTGRLAELSKHSLMVTLRLSDLVVTELSWRHRNEELLPLDIFGSGGFLADSELGKFIVEKAFL